jgi:CubicO group peptidase (beta-lactamase class C family)
MRKPLAMTTSERVRRTRSSGRFGSATIAELQGLVNQAAHASGVAGAQISVILDDERLDLTYGSTNAELNIPITPDTVVQIGSVGKVYNAAIIMTLMEQAQLDLDVPVIKYIPDLRLADQEAQDTITLRHLLSMSAGLDNGHSTPLSGDNALARYIALLRDIPQIFLPGRGFGYSTAGTCIAGYAAQRVTGVSWDTLLRERIFQPAELTESVTLADELPYHRISVGHEPARNGKPQKVIRPWYVSQGAAPGGATFASSARDLASFGRLFIHRGIAANANRILTEEAIATMMTPATEVPTPPSWGTDMMWGVGPCVSRWGDTVVWGHAGGNQSGGAQLVWIPEKRAVLAFTLNTIGAFDAFCTHMFGEFSQAVFGIRAPLLVAPELEIPIGNPERFVGSYSRNAMFYEISKDVDRLRYREICADRRASDKEPEIRTEGRLVSLGDDQFLVEVADRPHSRAVAFFGDDGSGRAAHLLAPLFATRRVTPTTLHS